MKKVRTGLDVAIRDRFDVLRGKKVAILANQAAVDTELRHLVDLVISSRVAEVKKLFAPEHGFRGVLQDMDRVDHATDRKTGLPVVSLYGAAADTLVPSADALSDVDALLVDLPDIGTRYYTFAQTLGYCMLEAAKARIEIIVLDRPNPIAGNVIEGASLERSCRSFCGLAPVAVRHGLTLGELALLMNAGFGENDDFLPGAACNLQIVQVEGWQRQHYSDHTRLPWVLPSPNMPTLDTAIVYPGTCLFEATNISEGRGSTRPFELLGAPFIDGDRWAEAAQSQGFPLAGATLRAASFMPKFQKWQNQVCHGVQLHVTDRQQFQPFRWAIALLAAAAELYENDFRWRGDAYEFVKDVPAIDLLFGSSALREAIDSRRGLQDLWREIERFEEWYRQARTPFLLY